MTIVVCRGKSLSYVVLSVSPEVTVLYLEWKLSLSAGENPLTSWDLEVWATKPPPWKWMTRHGDDGRRLAFSPSDREMAPASERVRDRRVSLSWGTDNKAHAEIFLFVNVTPGQTVV